MIAAVLGSTLIDSNFLRQSLEGALRWNGTRTYLFLSGWKACSCALSVRSRGGNDISLLPLSRRSLQKMATMRFDATSVAPQWQQYGIVDTLVIQTQWKDRGNTAAHTEKSSVTTGASCLIL
jgi:hypothetical protein